MIEITDARFQDGKIFNEFQPDTAEVGEHIHFLEELELFNRNNQCDLSVTNRFHWKNGTYDKIREMATKKALPYLTNRPRGSATITCHQQHGYQNWRTQLLDLESKMASKRYHGYTLRGNNDTGETRYSEFLEKLHDALSFPHSHRFEPPVIGYNNYGRRYRTTRFSNPNQNGWWEDPDPKPYIQFKIHLNDISISYYHNNQILATIPWGNLTIIIEVDLYWWCNSMIDRGSLRSGALSNSIQSYAIYKPHLKGLRHPYITWDGHAYQNGTICFGDHRIILYNYLHQFNFEHVYIRLMLWACKFDIGSTTPLNQRNLCHAGINSDWIMNNNQSRFWDYFGINPDTCKRVLEDEFDNDTKQFRDSLCTNCLASDIPPDGRDMCTLYTDKLSENAIDYEKILMNMLIAQGAKLENITPEPQPTAGVHSERRIDVVFFNFNLTNQAASIKRAYRDLIATDGINETQLIEHWFTREQVMMFTIHRALVLQEIAELRGYQLYNGMDDKHSAWQWAAKYHEWDTMELIKMLNQIKERSL